MRTENRTNHSIDLADIWTFERDAYIKDEVSTSHAKELLLKIQDEIIKIAEPAFGINDKVEDDSRFHKYFDRNLKTYTAASNNLKELFQLDFFFNKSQCYQYDNPIIIAGNHPDFDFWFALKLMHYQLNLKQLDEFLNYHLKSNFGNEKLKFQNFLKIVIRQYSEKYFPNGLSVSLNEWISVSPPKTKIKRKNFKRISTGDIHSFYLVSFLNNPDYFTKNANGFLEVFRELKKHKFIADGTDYNFFKNIFINQKIPSEQRIKWTGSNVELNWFISILMYETEKIDCYKNEIWRVTIKCFTNKEGENFEIGQLSNASGKNIARRKLLEKIIDGIPN